MAIQTNFPAIKPSLNLDFASTKMLDSRVTFTRASTGTYYNGVTTALAEQNLLTYSQEFDNAAWTKTLATVTANSTTAPDGTSTADTINGSAGSAYILEAQTVTSGVTYTFSVYAKANTTNFLQLAAGSSGFGTNVWANFDLSGGTVGSTGASTTASIQSVGSGWYRCVITGAATASISPGNIFALIPVESASATRFPTNAGATSIYVWGAQFEQRSTVTAYTATTTQPITNYIPVLLTAQSGVPRFDHNPTTDESLGLLIEESRTNLLTYSEQFDNAAWTKTASTITSNTVVAPDGTLTGDKLVEDTSNASHLITRVASVTSGTAYTYTLYAKAAERTIIRVAFGLALPSVACTVSLVDGSVSDGTPTVQSVGNGWWRISLTATATSTSNAEIYTAPRITTGGGSSAYTGDGYSGIYIWGAQLEAGSFATSYIQTVASQVTRAADAASMTGTNFSSWYNAGEGSFYSEMTAAATGFGVFFANSASSASNSLYTRVASSGPSFAVVANGVTQANIGASALTAKIANAYKVNDFATSVNGGAASTDTDGILPVVNALGIGATTTPNTFINGTIKKIAYYPMRVTNAQLQALTS